MTDEEARALLWSLDEPGALERPSNFDHSKARAARDLLAERLDAEFATTCRVDRQVQDASLYSRIEIPVEALRGLEQIVISISNFGALTVVAAENPGVYLDLTEAIEASVLDAADLAMVQGLVAETGHVEISERLVMAPYDGPGGFAARYPGGDTDWWLRYFDYL